MLIRHHTRCSSRTFNLTDIVSIRFSASYYNPIYVPMLGYYGKAEIKEDETNAIQQ